ncbi:MAG: undecaprenyldiphospho-muramoylpentapeptide beta-N-acetylglucosaminyltransferase [Eggerthellaceae bacterium]|nr:undecaprenyldiphospho-muramoylpentapeptide beta-N-acetylglucosaminyltransferase [Eggerthellaceae bacterium]
MLAVLAGGGTAGHINPALALAEALGERGHEVLFAGTPQGIEGGLVQDAGISFTAFEASGFNRNHPTTIVSALWKMAKSTRAARKWLGEVGPDVVVCFGGYVTVALGRAAAGLGIPVVIHEQNSVMGLANRYLARRATKVAVTYECSAETLRGTDRLVLTGNPVRRAVIEASREEGRALLGVPEGALVLLVFGGSLGAHHINDALLALKDRLFACADLHIVHIAGHKDYEAVASAIELCGEECSRWQVFAYQSRMGEVLAASDMVVARAGATSLAEISARHTPALLVPFPFATGDHQTKNASVLVQSGAALMVADDKLDTPQFADALFTMIEDPAVRERMKSAQEGLGTAAAASRLADVVVAAAQ